MGINGTKRERAASRIRVEAPIGVDLLTIAQAIVGPDILLKAEHIAPIPRNPFERWLVMRQLFDKTHERYGKRLDLMAREIEVYILQNILKGREGMVLSKADPTVDPAHLDEIAQIVIDHHAAFVADFGGANTKAEVARLVKEGKLPPKSMEAIFDSYTYGLLTGRIAKLDTVTRTKKMSYVNFTQRKRRKPITLTEQMKNAIAWMKRNAGEYIRNYGNKIGHELVAIMGEMKNDHRQWRQVAAEIGHRTGKWKTDLKRIAATEMHRAMQEGYSAGLKEREGDPENILVVKLPNPDACKNCIRLHLKSGRGSSPRVFTLAQLEANGSNTGRKRPDWKAVVGTVHPWCACELIHLPPGWGYENKPPKDKGWVKVPKKKAWRKKVDGKWRYWSPRMVPESLRRGLALRRDLRKGMMTYGDSVPEKGVVVRVGDPEMREAIEEVLRAAPPELFDKKTGVTLITTDIPRPGVALDEHDLAYWTGNEIRISQTLPLEKVRKVMRHELGHVLNVHLINKWGGEAPVIAWHNKLFAVAKQEGFISKYAATLPIECAAEATRLYLFNRQRLMLKYPKQFAILHEAYRDVFRPNPRANLPEGEEEAEESHIATYEELRAFSKAAHKLHYRTEFQGLPISIENRKGSHRHWTDHETGETGSTKMLIPYGYIRGYIGRDGDAIDVFLGPNKESTKVFIVNQRAASDLRKFDEHKVMLGFDSMKAAKTAYLKHYDDRGPSFMGSIREWSMPRFKTWLERGKLREPVSKGMPK